MAVPPVPRYVDSAALLHRVATETPPSDAAGGIAGAATIATGDHAGGERTYLVAPLFRTVAAATLYGVAFATLAPLSPMFRISAFAKQNPLENKELITIVSEAFGLAACSSGAAYAAFVDRGRTDGRWAPRVAGFAAVPPIVAALAACHLAFPGLYAVMFEPTAARKRAGYVRLTSKCVAAFGKRHAQVTAGLCVSIGGAGWAVSYFAGDANKHSPKAEASKEA